MIKKCLSVLSMPLLVVSLSIAPLTDTLADEASRGEKRAKIVRLVLLGLMLTGIALATTLIFPFVLLVIPFIWLEIFRRIHALGRPR